MNFFKRLFKIGEANTNSAIDKLEDPIAMTEQGIRDLKEDLSKGMEALAKVKAISIRTKSESEEYKDSASDYENKALLLLQKAEKGELKTADADRLATEALIKKNEMSEKYLSSKKAYEKNQKNVNSMQNNIDKLKSTINKWESELKTLKSRHKVSEATKNINKQLAAIDSDSTIDMLKRMKEKVAEQEALSDAYAEISNDAKSLDSEIDEALDVNKDAAKSDLEKLKEKISKGKN